MYFGLFSVTAATVTPRRPTPSRRLSLCLSVCLYGGLLGALSASSGCASFVENFRPVIYGKTAKLFECAAEAGASLGNPALQPALAAYARHLGAAFQIIDDVLDYTSSAEVMGKNVGDDLAEGKPTLPLIQAIKLLPENDAQLIRDAIRTGGLEHLDRIIALVRQCGALDYTMARARIESDLALASLAAVPASPWKQALEDLTRLALARTS